MVLLNNIPVGRTKEVDVKSVAASEPAQELLEIEEMLTRVEVLLTLLIEMLVDNLAGACQSEDNALSSRAKHIDFARCGLLRTALRSVRAHVRKSIDQSTGSAQARQAADTSRIALVEKPVV